MGEGGTTNTRHETYIGVPSQLPKVLASEGDAEPRLDFIEAFGSVPCDARLLSTFSRGKSGCSASRAGLWPSGIGGLWPFGCMTVQGLLKHLCGKVSRCQKTPTLSVTRSQCRKMFESHKVIRMGLLQVFLGLVFGRPLDFLFGFMLCCHFRV